MAALLLLFALLCLIVAADIAAFTNNTKYQKGWLGPYPSQTFFSDPDIVAPVANVLVNQRTTPERFVTWAPHGDNITVIGPQLLDAESLSVIYQGPKHGQDTFGVSVQSCNSTDYLVWWAGDNVDGRAAGNYYIYNSSYHLIWNVSAIGREYGDAHDVYLTSDCHLIFTVYESREYDLAAYHVDGTWLLDSYFQEIDLATNTLLFEWRASDHVGMIDSFWAPDLENQGDQNWHAWDYFHINSVQKDRSGNYLISARHTCAIYYIDGRTGAIVWTLGGSQNYFEDLSNGRATDFSWQHHARWLDEDLTRLSLFDDRSSGYLTAEEALSRGIILDLDYQAMTVRLVNEYWAPDQILSTRKGGMQVLDNGNVLLGFGSEPAMTEYGKDGRIVWDVRFGPVMEDIDRETADNYRAYKINWVGTPHWSPKIAAGPSIHKEPVSLLNADNLYTELANDTAYFSWNGATELDRWLVLVIGHDMKTLTTSMVLKDGFESAFHLDQDDVYVRAVALHHNKILGETSILDMSDGSLVSDQEVEAAFNKIGIQWLKWQRAVAVASGRFAITIYCILGVVCCYFAFALLRKRRLRRGYQIVQQPSETTDPFLTTRNQRQFSISSAVEPLDTFPDFESRTDTLSEVDERRSIKARIRV